MKKIARWRHVAATCAFVVSVALSPLATAAMQDDAPDLEDWQRSELRKLVEIVAAAVSGDLVQLENPFTVTPDFLKGTDNLTYVPYRVSIDASRFSASSVAAYLFVVPHQDAPDPDAELDDRNLPESVFEDAYFIDATSAPTDGSPIELHRAFSAAGGLFDVYIALSESLGEDADDDERDEATVMLAKVEVDIPDFWNGELQTSSVLMASSIEPLDRPLSPEEQAENPYTLGTTRILPKADANYAQGDDLSLIMLVYNAGVTSDQKPDLTIEYNFHKQTEDGEEYFNKTNPQEFNGQTLPPAFDMSAGHQIVAGQTVPLGSFPAGDYRLEILITDNEGDSDLTQNVNFSILGG